MQKKKQKIPSHDNIWQLQEAKAKFSQLVETVSSDGYQVITKNGKPVVVVLSKEAFDQMTRPKNSLLEFFNEAPLPELDLDVERSKELPRAIEL